MELFYCENVFVPLRSGPSHRSEMLSQILFGEKYIITDRSGNWAKIETTFDKYDGWIDMDHLQHTPAEDVHSGSVINRSLQCFKKDKTVIVIEAGSEIYEPDFDGKTFTLGKNVYNTCTDFNNSYITSRGTHADTALKFINSPYLWGGRIPSGIDCSGFTQLIYKLHGKAIPRNSWQQAKTGDIINFIDEAQTGDLVFFDNESGKITHVGMILSQGLVIHASGRVRIDRIDHQGIFKAETETYSHHLRMIKRLLSH
jgi:cell wall-associated NlpC family hydrolase